MPRAALRRMDSAEADKLETRKRKSCKIVVSNVSFEACESYSSKRNSLKDQFEENGRHEIANKKRKRDAVDTIVIFSFSSKSKFSNKFDSSLIIQKSRNHFSKFVQPAFVHNSAFASGLTIHNLFSVAMRKHANSSALVVAPSRGCGSQKHLQTTRCDAIIAVSEIATQVSNEITLAIARTRLCSVDKNACFDPVSMHGARPTEIIDSQPTAKFLSCCSSLCFLETTPRFLSPHDLLEKITTLAKDEASKRVVSSKLPQSTKQLQLLLSTLAFSESDGGNVWRAISIVQYLSTTDTGKAILEGCGINSYARAVVHAVSSFARFVVGNRARREAAGQSAQAKKEAAEATVATSKAAANDKIGDVDLSTVSVAVAASRLRALSRRAQRKTSTQLTLRTADDVGIYTGNGLICLLDFIVHALASPQADFLKLLVSEKTGVSKESGQNILNWQLTNGEQTNTQYNTDIATNVDEASRNSALSLRNLMLRILLQKKTESPVLQTFKCRTTTSTTTCKTIASKQLHIPLCSEDSNPAPHMVLVAEKKDFSNAFSNSFSVAWVSHTAEADEFGAVEALLFERNLENKIQTGELSGRHHRVHSMAVETRRGLLGAPLPSCITGVARSLLVTTMKVNVTPGMLAAAKKIADAAVSSADSTDSTAPSAPSAPSAPIPEAHATAQVSCASFGVGEVDVVSSPVTVGMLLQEAYRTASASCNKPRPLSLFFCAPHTEQQLKRETFATPSFQPNSLLHVVDLKFESVGNVSTGVPINVSTSVQSVQMATTIAVAAEHPIPLIEAMRLIGKVAADTDETRAVSYLRQQRSLMLMGAVQAFSLARTANAAAARESTVVVSNTHHILFPDNHRHLFPTLSQLFVVGLNNLPFSFVTTPWEGVYGGAFETGAVGDVGLAAQNMTSDRRHVPSVISQEHVDALSVQVASTCCVAVSDNGFAEIPLELRGILRGCVAGVHSCLNPLTAGFETLRHLVGIQSSDTAMTIQCLPLSPISEAVKPCINTHSMDPSELVASAYIYDDSTPLRQSVLGPFFDATRVRATTLADNPYESIEENMQVCIMIASMLFTLQCETQALLGLDLKAVLEIFFLTNRGKSSRTLAIFAVDIFVLFCCLFPTGMEVGKPALPLAAQTLPRLAHEANVTTINEVMERSLLSDNAATEAMQFVGALTDNEVVWSRQTAFIECVGKQLSDFDACPVDKTQIHGIIEDWCRSVWDMHQNTELDASPVFDLPSRDHVVARDLMVVYIDRPSFPDPRRQKQRGGLVGLPMFGFIQICTLLNAASTVTGTKVNWFRNEGGVTLRPSGFALKGEMNGQVVSNKSISPVQSECDVEAFGTKTAKEDGARRQAAAFEANNLLLIHVTRHVHPPLPPQLRVRGASVNVNENLKNLNAMAASGHTSTEELEGIEAVENACKSGL